MIDRQDAGHGPADAVAPIHSVRAEAVCQQVQEGDPQQDLEIEEINALLS